MMQSKGWPEADPPVVETLRIFCRASRPLFATEWNESADVLLFAAALQALHLPSVVKPTCFSCRIKTV